MTEVLSKGFSHSVVPKPDKWFESSNSSDCSRVVPDHRHVAESIRPTGQSSSQPEPHRDFRDRSAQVHPENVLCRAAGEKVQRDGQQLNTKYATRFVESYKDSQKPTHLRFLRFVSFHVDQLERSNEKNRSKLGARSKAMPKNRPAHRGHVLQTTTTFLQSIPRRISGASEDFEEEVWDQVPEANNLKLLQMQDRLRQMENVMSQVLHLSKTEDARSNQSA